MKGLCSIDLSVEGEEGACESRGITGAESRAIWQQHMSTLDGKGIVATIDNFSFTHEWVVIESSS